MGEYLLEVSNKGTKTILMESQSSVITNFQQMLLLRLLYGLMQFSPKFIRPLCFKQELHCQIYSTLVV